MNNSPDYGFIDELEFQQNSQIYQANTLQQEQISTDQRNSQVIQGTTQRISGIAKNIPKQFCRALKQYIQESFSKEVIENHPELKNFIILYPEKYSKTVLTNFLETNIGRQLGQIFFGSGKFCQYFIANNKSNLSPNDLFNELPNYYQKQSSTNNQNTIDQNYNYFESQQQFQAESNQSIGYFICTRTDSHQDEENLPYYE